MILLHSRSKVLLISVLFIAAFLLSACTGLAERDSDNSVSPGIAVEIPNIPPGTSPSETGSSEAESSQMEISPSETGLTDTDSTPVEHANDPVKREISVTIPIISWSTMRIDHPDLTVEHRAVLQYFESDYYQSVSSKSYKNLQYYPEAYHDAQIVINGGVVKSLGSIDDEFGWLVSMGGMEIDTNGAAYDVRCFIPDDISTIENLVVVKSKTADAGIAISYNMSFYGCYQDVETYELDGKLYQLPTISVNFYEYDHFGDARSDRFTFDVVNAAAKAIFGNDTTIQNPNWDDPDRFYESAQPHYVAALNRAINADFNYFAFNTWRPFIDPWCSYDDFKQFFTAVDLQHYFIATYSRDPEVFCLEFYDKDFNKLWEREFDNADFHYEKFVPFDYTSELIYLVADTDLHIIDIKTGEDIISPTSVGEKVKVSMVDDGVLLIGKGRTDNIMKTDFAGNILWRASINVDVYSWQWWSSIQIVNGNLVTQLSEKWESKTVVVSADGEVLYEFAD
jgi:hypothetical protein